MNRSKIFIFIAVFAVIGAAALWICALRQPHRETWPIKSAVSVPVEEKIPLNGEIREMEAQEEAEIEIIQREIKTMAEGEVIKYQEEYFYSENDFSVISENGKTFESRLAEEFKNEIPGVEVLNCKAHLNPSKESAVLHCDIKGAMYSESSYDMHFLLNGTARFGVDLYGFQEYESKLVYAGDVNKVPTTIVFEFPYALSHCHEHVWPK